MFNLRIQEMNEIATENFQRICEAYEILSDENKRQIYDIYAMEGLKSGLEIGVKLNKAEEIKEELEKLRRRKELEKLTRVRPSGSVVASLSLPHFSDGDGIMRGMAMASQVQSQLSKGIIVTIGGNLAATGNTGGGASTIVLRHQVSSAASAEYMASAGVRSLIGVQTTRQLSPHSIATGGLAVSLNDGSINLTNIWTRQMSKTSVGHIQLLLGTESSIDVGTILMLDGERKIRKCLLLVI